MRNAPLPTPLSFDSNNRALLLDRDQVVSMGISKRFLEISAMRGNGPPFIKIGRSVRYRLGDLLDWIDANRFTSTTEVTQRQGNSGAQNG